MKLALKLLLVGSCFQAIACDYYGRSKGIILDEVSGKPIKDAEITFGRSKTVSDSVGRFEVTEVGDANPKLTVAKSGYKPFALTYDARNEKCKMELDNEVKYNDLSKPRYLNDDSSSYVVTELVSLNSIHFEFKGSVDSLVVYLEKIKE